MGYGMLTLEVTGYLSHGVFFQGVLHSRIFIIGAGVQPALVNDVILRAVNSIIFSICQRAHWRAFTWGAEPELETASLRIGMSFTRNQNRLLWELASA